MKWQSGQPISSGFYLCAVIGNYKPMELYWDGLSWSYLVEYDGWEIVDNNEVSYYMDFEDIPMPEDW